MRLGYQYFAALLYAAIVAASPATDHYLLNCTSPVLQEYFVRQEADATEGTRVWLPKSDNYLFMHCVRNQISNRVRCIHYHMLLAGLLNRRLLVPASSDVVIGGYDLRMVFDVVHARHCYGRGIVTVREYMRKHRWKPTINEIRCWHGPTGACGARSEDRNCPLIYSGAEGSHSYKVDSAHFKLGERIGLGASLKLSAACLPWTVTLAQAVDAFSSSKAKILLVGDLVQVDIVSERWNATKFEVFDRTGRSITSPAWRALPFGRTGYCPSDLAVQPDGALIQAAKVFAAELFKGRPYVAVHWRRGDFKSYCFWHGPIGACYYPPKQVAWFIAQAILKTTIRDIFLATNGNTEEVTKMLLLLRNFTARPLHIVQLPDLQASSPSWMEPIARRKMDASLGLVSAIIEKLVCAFSAIFLGSEASTFSQDIQRMRIGLGTYSCNDTKLCYGQDEWVKNKG